MNISQIEDFFIPLKDKPCPITDRLVKNGYQQKSGGYIEYARSQKMIVDHKKALPKQSWHLLDSCCARSKKTDKFTKQIKCGELIFWMAEVSGAMNEHDLNALADTVLEEPQNRVRGNKLIQEACFDKIIGIVKKKQENDIKDNAFSNMYSVAAFMISIVSMICDLFFNELTSVVILMLSLVITTFICGYYDKTISQGVSTQSNKILQICNKLNTWAIKIGYLSYAALAVSYIFKLLRIEMGMSLIAYLIKRL